MENEMLPMHTQHHNRRQQQAPARRAQYRVVNHKEAGLFDSMTGATLWALKNLKDWNWQVEPV